MRRIIITVVTAAAVLLGLTGIALATSSGSAITSPRLDRSVEASFSNVYSHEATLLGHRGVTPATLKAKAMCDKGPGIPQSGPGTTWNCLMSWHDPATPMPSTGYGKFELTVHSNGCYTVGSPSSLIGYQTITDSHGKTVYNPAYEFDGCLDPNSSNTPNGVTFGSALTITDTAASVTTTGDVGVDLACGVGKGGCVGSVTATSGKHSLGTASFAMTEQATTHLAFPTKLPSGATNVTYTIHATSGIAPSPATLSVSG